MIKSMSNKSSKLNLQEMILREIFSRKAIKKEDLIEQISHSVPKKEQGKTKLSYSIARTLKTMEKRGYISVFEGAQSEFIKITKAGRHQLSQFYLSSDDHIVPTTWDGKWRVVILDVPETDKQTRNALRYILKKANFLCLKNSVWISPYSFEQFLFNMKENLNLHDEMIILVTDYLDPRTQDAVKERFLEEVNKG